MRILHTSDWHLGRGFHGADLTDAQQTFLDHFVRVVEDEHVDVVVVAGDVYDRALPNVAVVGMLDRALRRLVGAGARLVVTSGNHDSATRLGFASGLLEGSGLSLRTDVADLARPVLVPDPAGGGDVAFYGIPYLEPALAAGPLHAARASHQAVLGAAMDRVRADLADRAAGGPRSRAVVVAHAFVTGAEPSDSERDISVGGVGQVPAAVFDGVDYVALGHLHGRQSVGDSGRVRYPGSPLPYSFGEWRRPHGALLVDLAADGTVGVRDVDVPGAPRLAVLRGTLEHLLADPALDGAESAWCQVTLTDDDRPRDAMARIRTRFPDTLVLEFDSAGRAGRGADTYSARVRGRDDLDVTRAFLDHVRHRPADPAETRVLADAWTAVRRADATEAVR